jgi:hypothetical protein
MKKIFLLSIVLLSLFLMSCEQDLNSPNSQSGKNTYKGNGIVEPYGWEIRVGLDIYHFGSLDNKTPSSEGFKPGDGVYFEAEIGWSNGNVQGGTTYWCKLLLIRKG